MADVIISDYSTVIYEAGLLDIPVYLYAYDWATYREKRGLTIDFENDVPALFTDDPDAIIKAIEDEEFDADAYRVFENTNVTLPKNASCTKTICEAIISVATSYKNNS